MAVSLIAYPSQLTLVREIGLTNEGKPMLRSKTFSNVKADVSNEDLYAVADALSELFAAPVVRIERRDSGTLADI